MSGTFTGFSEDDIKNLKSGKTSTEVAEDKSPLRKFIKVKRNSNQINSKSKLMQTQKAEIISPISDDAKLSVKEDKVHNQEVVNQPVASEQTAEMVVKNETNKNSNLDKECTSNLIVMNTNKIEKNVIDLDEFQAKQKRIEEQNRMRKELLSKALALRTRQTEEEARRLKEIQNEFKRLDAILSDDVTILRHQIEIASLDFMEAQKRYHKIEKEFLGAKLSLHQKLERKEMLTEHLCAIIEKNEERKAEKLNELMARLTVGGKPVLETIECEENKIKLSDNEIIFDTKIEVISDTHGADNNSNEK